MDALIDFTNQYSIVIENIIYFIAGIFLGLLLYYVLQKEKSEYPKDIDYAKYKSTCRQLWVYYTDDHIRIYKLKNGLWYTYPGLTLCSEDFQEVLTKYLLIALTKN